MCPVTQRFRALYHCRPNDFWLLKYEICKLMNAESKQTEYHNPSWEVCLEIICLFWKPKIHYHFTQTLSSLSQTNPAHILVPRSITILLLQSPPRLGLASGLLHFFPPFVRPGPSKFPPPPLPIRRGSGPNKFTRKYFSNFFKFIH